MTPIVIAVIVILVVIAVGVWLARRNRSDGVASFQRQIDALSPEARRPVVDQVQRASDDTATADDDGGADDEDSA